VSWFIEPIPIPAFPLKGKETEVETSFDGKETEVETSFDGKETENPASTGRRLGRTARL